MDTQNTKLQALTSKLYEEGLAKGRAEGEAIVAKANAQAEEILSAARAEAAQIVSAAEKQAADYSARINGDLRLAAVQTVQTAKKAVEELIVAKAGSEKVGAALADADFVKQVISAVAANFSTQGAQDLSLVLPESLTASLESYVKAELPKIVGKGVNATFSKKISGGFTIGPADGSYFISFTDETFKALVGDFLRPATKKLLFGE